MEISLYLEPINPEILAELQELDSMCMGNRIKKHLSKEKFPNIEDYDIAIIGVEEDRKSVNNKGCGKAPNEIRKDLYRLYEGNYNTNIIDLGNIICGESIKDTYFAVSFVVSELLAKKIVPVIIGGSQDIVYANYRAYENIGQIINIAQVDSSFDIGRLDDDLNSKTYLSKIITHQPNYLFNYTNIGYQTYFVDQKAIKLMRKLYFDCYRLGFVRSDMEEVEPMIRNADMFCFDISAIRQSDAPGNGNTTPNGFYGEEACQIARYAGISDKLTSIGFYETNPTLDTNCQTTHLTAQIIWHFFDGFYNRKNDFPYKEKEKYIKYQVVLKEQKQNIIFYKSKKSDRWWMEVPCPSTLKKQYDRQYLVPCSYNDYQTACKNDIPDRWWQVYQKFM